ncbi:hypothetical protein PanWU01x14_221550 [Parasponia andersonii]|uniref:Uncharacterized protein n=1 Tax=Parasponia andersonii TaxID=3476 RepID=A0A2P5BPA4_PARAD|nr:hypothetical protein PanWU01x14_221550 [Parasponia andersonii]
MDSKGTDSENWMRSRSFRNEDQNNRRVFLRSYPLQWGGEEEEGNEEKMAKVESNHKKREKTIKKIILAVFHWGNGKALVLRNVKNKLTIHFVACIHIAFKPPAAIISA